MKRAILTNALAGGVVPGHWAQEQTTIGGVWDPIANTSNVLTFTHGGTTTMAASNVAFKVRMPSPDYSVRFTATYESAKTGVILCGVRCVGPASTDADRIGYWVGISFGETGAGEGSSDNWEDNKVRIYKIPLDFDWDNLDRLTLSSTEGKTDPADSKQADLTTVSGTNIEFVVRVAGERIEVWADGTLIAVATDTSYTIPGFVRLGAQSDEASTVATISNITISSALSGTGSGRFVTAGFDEAQNHAYFNVPAKGQEYPSRQFVYDVAHDEWYLRDRTMRAIGQVLSAHGERQMVFGDDNGFVSILDPSVNTWSDGDGTNAFTGTWTSNWLDFGDGQQRKRIERLIVGVAKATSNTAVQITIETRDHADGLTDTRKATVHLQNLRTPILTRIGGRYIRVTVQHTAEGDMEIERILAELAGATLDRVEVR